MYSTPPPRPQGDNLFKLFGATGLAASSSAYMLLAAAIMIPTVWLPDLKALSFLGAAGVTATCTVSAAVRGLQVTGGVWAAQGAQWSPLATGFAMPPACWALVCRRPGPVGPCPLEFPYRVSRDRTGTCRFLYFNCFVLAKLFGAPPGVQQ